MLINNKSLIKTINKLNLTEDERDKFNKISEDDKGNFIYNGKSYNDYKIICTKSGIIPQCGCWGFGGQMTGYEDLVKNKYKLQGDAYVYYKDNLYRNIGTDGTIDMENPPIHTQGVATCGEVELEFIDKIGMAKLIGIE